MPSTVEVREVAPRDGLQVEAPQSVEDRIRLVDALSATGLRRIEAAAFVHPVAVPAMAGAEAVIAGIARRSGVIYSALVPNLRGAERALGAGVDELEVVVSASESHNRANVNMSVVDSIAQVAEIVKLAHSQSRPVEAVVATAFGCPYEGDVPPERVASIAARLLEVGSDTVGFGDTTGMATPKRVELVSDALELGEIDLSEVLYHFHNTRGTGLANVVYALGRGVRRFDASVGGLGGCPFAPGASGNICTEDLVHMLEDMGVGTGVDLEALIAASLLAQEILGHELPGQIMKAGPRTRRAEGRVVLMSRPEGS
ncbi:MAG: hydroxymethylglutaryl-CoA lyase [Acidimicrobiia bacterium]